MTEDGTNKIIIIGGGASGMMAGIWAARYGSKVLILEKTEKLGKKLFITGKGRCNVTNACDTEDFFKNLNRNPRFLYSSYSSFDNHSVMQMIEELGTELKVERGNRVFPVSDHSSDIIKALKKGLDDAGCAYKLHAKVTDVEKTDKGFKVSYFCDGKNQTEYSDFVIIATGGLSYKTTGSDGDGYKFAKSFGHTVTKLSPSLVAIETLEDFPGRLTGLSLKNISLTLKDKDKVLYKDLGEMLFTHFGVSGPLCLSASSMIAEYKLKGAELPVLYLDLKPGMTEDELDARLLKDFEKEMNKAFKNSLDKLMPLSLTSEIVKLSGIDPEKKVNSITREERRGLAHLLKNIKLTVSGIRDYNEAIITKGGISVNEINPKTMESKKVPGLYFTGEVLDIDAMTGGFNLQIAWSTGYAAGVAASGCAW